MRARTLVGWGLVASLGLVACSGSGDDGDEPPGPSPSDAATTGSAAEPVSARLQLPEAPTTVLPGATPAALAAEVSAALFGTSPAVVLVGPETDEGAATLAAELGVPVLVAPAAAPTSTTGSTTAPAPTASTAQPSVPAATTPTVPAEDGSATAAEIERLGASTVVAYGPEALALSATLGEAVTTVEAPAGAASAADLPPDSLPTITAAAPVAGLAALWVTGSDVSAAAATVQAAGGGVHEVPAPDPRTSSATIQALAALPPTTTLGLGAGFGTPELLAARMAVAVTGVELPGGGQVAYPYHRHIALYGNPTTGALGALGEQPLPEAVERAKALAAEYQAFTDATTVPTFEIITTVASTSAGGDGDYSNESDPETIRPYIEAAAEAGVYVTLDLQPGRTDFLTQAKRYEEFLKLPHVGLALDPEWRLGPGQTHLVQIGTVTAAEINSVVTWLADLTRDNALPQKVLVLHQFNTRMISDRTAVDTSRDELAVLIHVDGFGPPGSKLATWDRIRTDPPPAIWWGWKNFIDEDSPMLTPEETMAIEPVPYFVSYQ